MSYLENVWPVYSKRLLSNSGSYELSRIKALFNKIDKVRSVIFVSLSFFTEKLINLLFLHCLGNQ